MLLTNTKQMQTLVIKRVFLGKQIEKYFASGKIENGKVIFFLFWAFIRAFSPIFFYLKKIEKGFPFYP
jgi:hypothetical protein